jgi:prepilin-type N-terminal cleavage/methylation domain-containing protein
MKPKHFNAFTLIELLAVMAVIGILAAGVLTGYGMVRRRFYTTQATATTHRVANAFCEYYNVYGKWPVTVPPYQGKVNSVCLNHLTKHDLIYNPRKIVFLEVGPTATNRFGELADPWGNAYQYRVAPSLQSSVKDPFSDKTMSVPVAVWSAGADRNEKQNKDNPRNW